MSLSRSPLNPEGSEFLRSLREVTKMNSKLLDGIHSATLPKKSKHAEISLIHKKTPSSRQSHPLYFPHEPQSSHLPSQSPHPTTKKSSSKSKNSHVAIYHISNGAYGLSGSKPKLVTSISAAEFDTDEHHTSQTMIHPVHVSAFHKMSQPDPSPPKSYSRSPLMERGDYIGAREHSSNARSQPHGSSVYKTKATKTRKVSNNSKIRALSGMKYSQDTKTLPILGLPSQRRGLTSAATTESKPYINPARNMHINVQSVKELDQPFTSEGDDHYVGGSAMGKEQVVSKEARETRETREKKRTATSELVSPLKTSHPLKEIKIDICNLIDQPIVMPMTTAAVVENKKVTTHRNGEHVVIVSQRPEKNRTESTNSTRNHTGVSPHNISAPTTTTVSGLIKAKLAINTPKQQDSGIKKAAYKSMLTEEERKQYGDRFPEDFDKIDFLGRGGFALVWLGIEKKTGKKVAVKQILKGAGTESQKKELYYGQMLFGRDGFPQEDVRRYPGIKNIASFIEHKTTRHDEWLVSELGGKTLSKHLFDIKGEFYKGERIYRVKYGELSQAFKHDSFTLKAFIRQMAQVLHLLSEKRIVHCDLKPDNILINLDQYRAGKPLDLKVIDFGSAYTWDEIGNIGMATPEYMPPEFLSALLYRKGTKSSIEQLNEITNPWSIDVWSLGAIILEIITGVPLWMSLKCRLDVGPKSVFGMGLFAVKGRAYDKILQRQRSVMETLGDVLVEHLGPWADREALFDLINRIMEWDPMRRISPEEILQHPYLHDSNQ